MKTESKQLTAIEKLQDDSVLFFRIKCKEMECYRTTRKRHGFCPKHFHKRQVKFRGIK